jgi:hypothetical protein
VPDTADATISLNVVGALDDVWGEFGCQSVPVHDGGAELARRRHLRLQLEGPAVSRGHCYDYQLQLGANGMSRDYLPRLPQMVLFEGCLERKRKQML